MACIAWLGQVAPYYANITTEVVHQQVAPYVLGMDSINIAAIIDIMPDRQHKFPGSYLRWTMAGIDTALWDLQAKLKEKPVCCRICGCSGNLATYSLSMRRNITPKDEAVLRSRLRNKKEFDAFKFVLALMLSHNIEACQGHTEEIIPKISKAMGDNIALLVDANSCYAPECAIEVGYILQDKAINHYEDPCPYWQCD